MVGFLAFGLKHKNKNNKNKTNFLCSSTQTWTCSGCVDTGCKKVTKYLEWPAVQGPASQAEGYPEPHIPLKSLSSAGGQISVGLRVLDQSLKAPGL